MSHISKQEKIFTQDSGFINKKDGLEGKTISRVAYDNNLDSIIIDGEYWNGKDLNSNNTHDIQIHPL